MDLLRRHGPLPWCRHAGSLGPLLRTRCCRIAGPSSRWPEFAGGRSEPGEAGEVLPAVRGVAPRSHHPHRAELLGPLRKGRSRKESPMPAPSLGSDSMDLPRGGLKDEARRR
jgi:hypothetical protein